MSKLLSARFLLALAFGFTACYGFCVKLIPGEAFIAIVLVVVKDYFARSDRTNGTEAK